MKRKVKYGVQNTLMKLTKTWELRSLTCGCNRNDDYLRFTVQCLHQRERAASQVVIVRQSQCLAASNQFLINRVFLPLESIFSKIMCPFNFKFLVQCTDTIRQADLRTRVCFDYVSIAWVQYPRSNHFLDFFFFKYLYGSTKLQN